MERARPSICPSPARPYVPAACCFMGVTLHLLRKVQTPVLETQCLEVARTLCILTLIICFALDARGAAAQPLQCHLIYR